MKDVLALSDLAWLGAVAIVMFMTIFLGALIWMFRPGSKQVYAACSTMPLSDDVPVEPLPSTSHA
ncbi:cbb3-type cytochrome c oxidase subunit 3 [Nannocystaceae bacterium ST9]